jgi:Methyltransferase domain
VLSPVTFLDNLRRHLGRGQQTLFPGSANYWESRYQKGGTSGNGSYGQLALFKAEILNGFIAENQIDSVMEFGCGDGNQLGLLKCPQYIGVDISPTAIESCRKKYAADPTKRFLLADLNGRYPSATMAMSLDVIYHLTEDQVFAEYMNTLFNSSNRYVAIYSSNGAPVTSNTVTWPPHVLHRRFTDWVDQNAAGWKLINKIPNRYAYSRDRKGRENGSFADFYFYAKIQ